VPRSRESAGVHSGCVVIDCHCDALGVEVLRGSLELHSRPHGHFDVARAREGGLTCVFLACCECDGGPGFARSTAEALEAIARESGGALSLAVSVSDVRAARESGGLAAVLHLEGAGLLGDTVGGVRLFHELGARSVGLVHKRKNAAAESVTDCPSGAGLTDFGVKLVREMNALGMLIDVAHLSKAGLDDVLELSSAPVIYSHGNCLALCDHVRNLDDRQIASIASRGGVMCMSFVPYFLAPEREGASVRTLVEHVLHAASVGGIDHVGIGSDFDGFRGAPPIGLEDVSCYGGITAELLAAGLNEADCRNVMGGNVLRLMEEVIG